MEEISGFRGQWLSNDCVEAFVASEPWPRLLVFRMRGGESPFRICRDEPWTGLRTWFLEPDQNDMSGLPAQQAAQCLILDSLSVRLQGTVEPQSNLCLAVNLALDPTLPLLSITHRLTNHAGERRRIALWAICALARDGVGIVPHSESEESAPVLWPGFSMNDRCLRVGRQALAVDFREPPDTGVFKVGIRSDAGWIACLWPGGVMVSSVAVNREAEYPEGGGTVTMFSTGSREEEGWGEIENVGPLTEVGEGEAVVMQQQLRLLTAVSFAGDDPDRWMAEGWGDG